MTEALTAYRQASRDVLSDLSDDQTVEEFESSDLPAAEFARYLVERYGVSIVLDPDLYDVPITMSIRSESLQVVAELFARQLGSEVVTVGKTWYVGESVQTDRSLLMIRFPRLGVDQLKSLLASMLSEDAAIEVLSDGVVIVADRPANLRRVSEVRAALDRVESVTWAVQIFLVRDSSRRFREFGIDLGASIDLAYTAATASGGALLEVPSGLSSQVVSALTAALRAQATDSDSLSRVSPMLLCVDGSEASYQDGLDLLLETATTNGETGNSQTTFETVQTGLLVTVNVRETDYQTCRLSLELETSAPVEGERISIERRSLSCVADVRDGGVYLLGEVASTERVENLSNLLRYGVFNRDTNTQYQVWARCYRIGGTSSGKNHAFEARYGHAIPDSFRPDDSGNNSAGNVVDGNLSASGSPRGIRKSEDNRKFIGGGVLRSGSRAVTGPARSTAAGRLPSNERSIRSPRQTGGVQPVQAQFSPPTPIEFANRTLKSSPKSSPKGKETK